MKAFSKFLLVITLIVILLGVYLVQASSISISPSGALVESAADRQSAFDSLSQSIAVGSPDLILYDTNLTGSSADYIFVTYKVDFSNLNLLPAEWIQISLEPQTGDVLMIKPSIEDIAALDSEKVELVLMTSRSNSTAYSRTAEITYYVYGHEYTRQITLGAK